LTPDACGTVALAQDRKLAWIVNGEIYNHKKLKARAHRRAAPPRSC
jgi:asparagine synthetase B (glutamine-hydrolysing)